MISPRLSAVLVVVLIAGIAGGYGLSIWLGDDATSTEAQAPDRKVLYWHDPMVPGHRFEKPGKSPFMDMDLVPVYADEAPADGAVRISPQVSQSLGIRVGKVEKATLQTALTAVGSVVFNEELAHLVQARVDGYVERLHVRAPLESVRRGQALADIVAPEWLSAAEQYLALLDAASDRGKAIRDAARERLLVLGVPETSIRTLERNRKAESSITFYSPVDGVVAELGVRDGAAFTPGTTLFRINGLSSVWVTAQVPESQVSLIPRHGRVVARATAWPGVEFSGRVIALLPDVDPMTRTLPVRISVDNAEGRLVPGMYVSLDLAPTQTQTRLVVPSEAVIVTGERSVVIVKHGDGSFEVVDVITGPERNGSTVVLEGLNENDRIVLSGQFLIDSEASLKSAVSRLTSYREEAPTQEGPHDHAAPADGERP